MGIAFDDATNVYPNPVSKRISITSESKILNLKIFNLTGRKFYSGNSEKTNMEIDVSGWPAGIYIMKVNNTERKFIKH